MRGVTLVTQQNRFNHNELRAGSPVSFSGKRDVVCGQVGRLRARSATAEIRGKTQEQIRLGGVLLPLPACVTRDRRAPLGICGAEAAS
jgi:hypothetical protein